MNRHAQALTQPSGTPPPEDLGAGLADAARFREAGRPFVVLSYAQSVDGIAGRNRGDRLSSRVHGTHPWDPRACDGILIGIGTSSPMIPSHRHACPRPALSPSSWTRICEPLRPHARNARYPAVDHPGPACQSADAVIAGGRSGAVAMAPERRVIDLPLPGVSRTDWVNRPWWKAA
jgi:hypothetical protein